ncbi:S-adenosylmethionine-dependent methyltransferase [Tulasnella sp. JGI-2019a]|nr:S-adenosylmethionine-dependent methyltransferase [Tulasnella sp. JGI-2019a]KAG9015111.1 S-adenosylmethionine-dependent methyltransferase [Tulasnella sp. JGI-2019a]
MEPHLAEDTFILLDALERDAAELQAFRPSICLEIGSGSGCVTAFIASVLGPASTLFLATDINDYAAKATVSTGHQNQVEISSIRTSLAEGLQPRLKGNIDLLLFNPPYVPTTDSEASAAQDERGISGAWAGGRDGMDITNRLLPHVGGLLSPSGRFYLVALLQNNPAQICEEMRRIYGLDSKTVLQRRAGRERLAVLCFFWPSAV